MPRRETLELFAPFFTTLTDPRVERSKRHALLEIIIVAVSWNITLVVSLA